MPRRHKYPSFTSLPHRTHARAQAISDPDCERCGENCETVKRIETKRGPESVCYACRIAHAEAKRKGVDHAF